MDCNDFIDMVQLGQDNSTQCAVHDKTPGSDQKKINIVVRPTYTVGKVISDITTQYRYEAFDLLLQPISKGDLVYLNDCVLDLIYKVPGFQPELKNTLVLLPPGEWDGNVKQRFDLSLTPLKLALSPKATSKSSSTKKKNIKSLNIHCNNNNNSSSITNNDKSSHSVNPSQSQSHQSHIAFISGSADIIDNFDIEDTSKSPPSTMTTVANHSADNTSAPNSLNLSPMSDPDQMSDDDLALGASASPTETEPMNGGPLALGQTSPSSTSRQKFDDFFNIIDTSNYEPPSLDKKYDLSALTSAAPASATSLASGYVGLVNQAMTCYLNSLLQALYMTPEFRNALYRWEFDNDNEAKNIPYQLQKLFLNLQTSKKSAVETTDLTRSFGWDSTEAWQQHDIQELCRVMFDALEHKFKNTKQANLISTLYEGQMIDYVKCLECNTEKTRSDTFLDIPLPVRPFGSTVAYGSIEEALRAFVQPETLDGNNQYFCEKCNKKCDAHKGLKFKNFPYVLTLHLKRFDFDYQTMHRIKLNDKVTFPQTLNLNTFVNATDAQKFANLQTNSGAGAAAAPSSIAAATTANGYVLNGAVGTTDDCSTTDSGSAMEEDNCSSGIATTASSSQHENDMNDDDEGIDMSTSTDHRNHGSGATAEQRLKHESGPYVYDLFAIMIHSGSASGGHYYAYIRELENNEWFCFNDQTVSPITQEDIQRSFGGSSTKAYTSVYSSSTNAYMLMYRQIDAKRNEHVMKAPDLPEHIKTLLPKLAAEEETPVSRPGRHSAVTDLALPELIKPRVFFYNPQLKKLKVTRVYVSRSFDVNTVLESAYQMLNVEKFAPLSHCRLVGFDHVSEEILESFESVNDPSLAERSYFDTLGFLLEYRSEGQQFEVYKAGGTSWNVYIVHLPTMSLDGPFHVYSPSHECDDGLRHSIAARLYSPEHIKEEHLLVATLNNKKAFVAHDPAASKEAQTHLQALAKAHFKSLTHFFLNVPNTEPSSLEILSIPANEVRSQAPATEVGADVVDAVRLNSETPSGDSVANQPCHSTSDTVRRESPLPPVPNAVTGHESNSEDSSLSDGDRTLVESIPHQGGGDSQSQVSSSSSRSPQLSSPEDESSSQHQYYVNRIYDAFFNGANAQHGDAEHTFSRGSLPHYFHAVKLEVADTSSSHHHRSTADSILDDAVQKPATTYKIIVNSHMEIGAFKRHIESLIQVPANYFKVPVESVLYFTEGETLNIELGKELTKDEYKAQIFFMRLSDLNNESSKMPFVCEWIYSSTLTVAEAKQELVTKLHRIDTKYKTLTVDNCRIWLKGGRNPIGILGEKEMLCGEFRNTIVGEFIIQECEDGVKTQPSQNSITIFVRRWHADKLQLDKFQEITLEKDDEIRNTLSKITDLEEEHIAYTKINNVFPCTNISLLSINASIRWFSIPGTMGKYPLSTTVNGNVYFYKDVRPAPRELSPKERRELDAKEKTRLDRLGCMSVSLASPRRERALKIYLDSPQASPNSTAATTTSASSAKAVEE